MVIRVTFQQTHDTTLAIVCAGQARTQGTHGVRRRSCHKSSQGVGAERYTLRG